MPRFEIEATSTYSVEAEDEAEALEMVQHSRRQGSTDSEDLFIVTNVEEWEAHQREVDRLSRRQAMLAAKPPVRRRALA